VPWNGTSECVLQIPPDDQPKPSAGHAWGKGDVRLQTVASSSGSDEYQFIRSAVTDWAMHWSNVIGVAVVGSWARGTERDGSDIDILVLTADKAPFTSSDDWVEAAIGQHAPVARRAEWGVLSERRVRLPSGLEVEFGFVLPSWACLDPIDPGTARVVHSGGLLPLYDPDGLLERLAHHAGSVPPRTAPRESSRAR
jgi:hypothetical protein